MDMKEALQSAIDQFTNRLDSAMEIIERMAAQQASSTEASIGRIVATVEQTVTLREVELTERLAAAEKTIAELRASASNPTPNTNRRTIAAGLMAKQEGAHEAGSALGAIDAALVSLSMEQRFAVKAQLLRAGLV